MFLKKVFKTNLSQQLLQRLHSRHCPAAIVPHQWHYHLLQWVLHWNLYKIRILVQYGRKWTMKTTMMFNTDGIPLYKSSGISIWPIYLAINELPPKMRFSKKNMILWGVWQGKGKPVFQTFLRPFIEDMKMLKNEEWRIHTWNRWTTHWGEGDATSRDNGLTGKSIHYKDDST